MAFIRATFDSKSNEIATLTTIIYIQSFCSRLSTQGHSRFYKYSHTETYAKRQLFYRRDFEMHLTLKTFLYFYSNFTEFCSWEPRWNPHWFRQWFAEYTPSHYTNQYWWRCMTPCSVTGSSFLSGCPCVAGKLRRWFVDRQQVAHGCFEVTVTTFYWARCQNNAESHLMCWMPVWFNSSPPGQNGRYFADDIFKRMFMNEFFLISIQISLKFVPKSPIDN